MFINRKKELKVLETIAGRFESGEKTPLAIIGLRRIGKTELIQQFRRRRPKGSKVLLPYLNLQGSVSSPQTIAEDFYLAILEELAARNNIPFLNMGKKRDRILTLSALLGEDFSKASDGFLSTLDGGDYVSILQAAFEIPELIAEYSGAKLLIFLDEFQELNDLNNYDIGDVFGIMRAAVEKQRNVMYVISGSVISFMEHIIKGARQPFFNQFTELGLSYFTKEDAVILMKCLMKPLSYDEGVLNELFRYTCGHPFYITAICERVILESIDTDINMNTVRYAILRETLDKDGKINILFRYTFEESLKKAKRKGHLKRILLMLATKDGLNLTKLSEGLGKPTGQVSNYLKSLLKTDLVFEDGKKYYFRDPLFRFWIAKTQLGKDIEVKRGARYVVDLLGDLREKYLRASTELGKAKEYEAKAKLEVRFGLNLENYISEDGKIEFDLVGKKNGTRYLLEVKWRNRPATYGDVKKFVENVGNSEFSEKTQKLFFISKCGFTDNAKSLAKKEGVGLIENL